MSEPVTTQSIAISLGTVTVTGTVLGMGYDAMLFGFVGVLFSLRWLPRMTRVQLITAVISTTMLAALAGPLLASWGAAHITALEDHAGLLRSLCSLLVGAGTQLVFPAAVAGARKRLSGGG
jgi:hypothetical protein